MNMAIIGSLSAKPTDTPTGGSISILADSSDGALMKLGTRPFEQKLAKEMNKPPETLPSEKEPSRFKRTNLSSPIPVPDLTGTFIGLVWEIASAPLTQAKPLDDEASTDFFFTGILSDEAMQGKSDVFQGNIILNSNPSSEFTLSSVAQGQIDDGGFPVPVSMAAIQSGEKLSLSLPSISADFPGIGAQVKELTTPTVQIGEKELTTIPNKISPMAAEPNFGQDVVAVGVSSLFAEPEPLRVWTKLPELSDSSPFEQQTVTVSDNYVTDPVDASALANADSDMNNALSYQQERDRQMDQLNSADGRAVTAMASAAFEKTIGELHQTAESFQTDRQNRMDIYNVARQVLDGLSTSTDSLKGSQVVLTLKPEHLGEVTMKIQMEGDRVTASFHAASAEVRAILENSLPQLRQEMSQQGWNFESNGVYSGMNDFLANQQHQQESYQATLQSGYRPNNGEYHETLAFTKAGGLQILTSSAVDYRI